MIEGKLPSIDSGVLIDETSSEIDACVACVEYSTRFEFSDLFDGVSARLSLSVRSPQLLLLLDRVLEGNETTVAMPHLLISTVVRLADR